MTDYDAAKAVIKQQMEAYDWKCDQLLDELRDIRTDPEMGRECKEYKAVRRELSANRNRYWALYDLLETLDDDVRAYIDDNEFDW